MDDIEKDLSIVTFRNFNKAHMKITHKQTGISVSGKDITEYLLKKKLINELREKVNASKTGK